MRYAVSVLVTTSYPIRAKSKETGIELKRSLVGAFALLPVSSVQSFAVYMTLVFFLGKLWTQTGKPTTCCRPSVAPSVP